MTTRIMDSPMGPLTILSDGKAIVEIKYGEERPDKGGDEVTELCIAQLEEYFDGKRKEFSVPALPDGTDFQKQVWSQLTKIPFGIVKSYVDIARMLGDQKKVRAVGNANSQNPIPIIIPCHRVIGSDGSLIGYAGGLDKKEWLLRHEKAGPFSQTELFDY